MTAEYSDAMLTTAACHLYDGGWRWDDRAGLMKEYDLSAETAERICELLGRMEIEEKEGCE